MMTTLWPILILGAVSTLAIFTPAIVRAMRQTTPVTSTCVTDDEEHDDAPQGMKFWRTLLIATSLPLITAMLILWNAVAKHLGLLGLLFPIVLLLSVSGSACYAWQMNDGNCDGLD